MNRRVHVEQAEVLGVRKDIHHQCLLSQIALATEVQNRIGGIHDEPVEFGSAVGEVDMSCRTADGHARILADIKRQRFGDIETGCLDQQSAHGAAAHGQKDLAVGSAHHFGQGLPLSGNVDVRADLAAGRIEKIGTSKECLEVDVAHLEVCCGDRRLMV
jgi:hypothetical protein